MSQGRERMLRHSLTSLTVAIIFSALVMGLPTTANAIPVAGDYTFTSGLSGTFTSNGSSLTAWHITDQWGYSWGTNNPVPFVNDADFFRATNVFGSPAKTLTFVINWQEGYNYTRELTGRVTKKTLISYQSSAVPEPTTALLLLTGLGLLVGYGWRRQRQAGLHVS